VYEKKTSIYASKRMKLVSASYVLVVLAAVGGFVVMILLTMTTKQHARNASSLSQESPTSSTNLRWSISASTRNSVRMTDPHQQEQRPSILSSNQRRMEEEVDHLLEGGFIRRTFNEFSTKAAGGILPPIPPPRHDHHPTHERSRSVQELTQKIPSKLKLKDSSLQSSSATRSSSSAATTTASSGTFLSKIKEEREEELALKLSASRLHTQMGPKGPIVMSGEKTATTTTKTKTTTTPHWKTTSSIATTITTRDDELYISNEEEIDDDWFNETEAIVSPTPPGGWSSCLLTNLPPPEDDEKESTGVSTPSSSCTILKIEFRTDDWPEEDRIRLEDGTNGVIWDCIDFEEDTSYTFSRCIPNEECTVLHVTDTYGDGLLGSGMMTIYFGSDTLLYNEWDFGYGFDLYLGTTCS